LEFSDSDFRSTKSGSFDADVAAVGPTELCQSLEERRIADLTLRIVRGRGVQHTDPPHAAWLLRARRKWPRRRAAEEREELAPFYMTKLHPLPQARRQHNGLARLKSGGAAVRDFGPAEDRIGSKAAVRVAERPLYLQYRKFR
jgi:hypothetical protein